MNKKITHKTGRKASLIHDSFPDQGAPQPAHMGSQSGTPNPLSYPENQLQGPSQLVQQLPTNNAYASQVEDEA